MKFKPSLINPVARSRQAPRRAMWLPLLASVAMAACASFGNSPEDMVRQRATERWQALLAGQFDQAYTYSTAAFKDAVSVDSYRSRFGTAVKWLDGTVTSVNCPEATKCDVKLRIDYQPLLGRGAKGSTFVDETWLLESGQWLLFQPL